MRPAPLLALLPVLATACRDTAATGVTAAVPLAPPPTAITQMAVVHDVSLVATTTAPAVRNVGSSTFASLLGHEAFRVDVDGVRRSLVGQFQPGKVRVTLLLRVRNLLGRTALESPTFPVPPDGGGGLYLFPVSSVAIDQPGAVTTVAPNDVQVRAPGSGGSVVPSPDWDGAPYDYLRSAPCTAPGGTCARHERFAAPLLPETASEWRTVGFDVDPTVRHIRLRLLLAADLANVG